MAEKPPPDGFDMEKAGELTLALMVLGLHGHMKLPDGDEAARTWKSYDWDVLDHLHEQGYISNPVGKAKSVVLTTEGLKRARELFARHLGTA